MIRERLVEREVGVEPYFRWRGGEITRIEGFSDAVFAFAVTLLVVSLEVPKTFDELLEVMRGFIAFAICFLMLLLVWNWHYRFFRRYGLQDSFVTTLNGVLLFLVLFYVYPLKFLFTVLVDSLMGRDPTVTLPGGAIAEQIETGQFPTLMYIYGAGFLAVAVTFAIFYWHAYRHRDKLGLDEAERLATISSIQRYLLMGGIAVLSIVVALIGGPGNTQWAGWTYALIAPVLAIHGSAMGRRVREAKQTQTTGQPNIRARGRAQARGTRR